MGEQEEISVSQAAKKLRCGKDAIYRMIESGDIHAYRLPPRGQWRVLKTSVEKLLLRLSDNLIAK